MIKHKTEFCVGILTILVAMLFLYSVGQIPEEGAGKELTSASFPRGVSWILLVVGLIQTGRSFNCTAKNYWTNMASVISALKFFLIFCGYIVLISCLAFFFKDSSHPFLQQNISFYVSSVFFLFAATYFCGRRRKLELAAVSLLIPVAIIVFFGQCFEILLP